MKTILKLFLLLLLLVICIVIIAVAWIFSDSGNKFLAQKIETIANEKSPISLKINHFVLKPSNYEVAISDEKNSQVALNGTYSIFSLSTNANIVGAINDLGAYEKLIGLKLNGGAGIDGKVNVENSGKKISANLNLNVAKSQINADVSLVEYKPERLFLNSKDGLNIGELLNFLNQPKYASGLVEINADLDISNLAAPSGGFALTSKAISPNVALLKKQFGVILPNESLFLSLKGEAAQNAINAALDITSSYLEINSQNIQIALSDFSTKAQSKIELANIGYGDISLPSKIIANLDFLLNPKGENKKLQGDLALRTEPIILPNAWLNNLSGLNFKNALKPELSLNANLKNEAINAEFGAKSAEFELNAKNIKAASGALGLDFNFKTPEFSKINPLQYPLKGALALVGNAKIAGDKISAHAENHDFGGLVLDFNNGKLNLKGQNLEAQKIAYFVNYENLIKGGQIALDADLDLSLGAKMLNGTILAQSSNLLVYTLDIDGIANSFKGDKNQNIEAGAALLGGFLKGDLGTMKKTQNALKALNADFVAKNGVISARDVALKTANTRLAAKGAIDINTQTYKNFSLAILDSRGCSTYTQKVEGKLNEPKIVVEKQNVVASATKIAGLLGQLGGKFGKEAAKVESKLKEVSGANNDNCEVYYDGVVK